MPQQYSQARYWLLTIPHHAYLPYLPPKCAYIRGQLERGNDTGFLHWQLLVIFRKKIRLRGVTESFGEGIHAEPSRSDAADAYVWKDDTYVDGTRFELGTRPIKRCSSDDWDRVRSSAMSGRLVDVPSDIYVRYYGNLRRIATDHLQADPIERTIYCFVGTTGTGKSRRAWTEAGLDAYPKDPNTKFWDGYRGQDHVVIDEFRGVINISNVLRWFDRYPVLVEVKGSSVPLKATKIWVTSNLHPQDWYPTLDQETRNALLRRLTVVLFPPTPFIQ